MSKFYAEQGCRKEHSRIYVTDAQRSAAQNLPLVGQSVKFKHGTALNLLIAACLQAIDSEYFGYFPSRTILSTKCKTSLVFKTKHLYTISLQKIKPVHALKYIHCLKSQEVFAKVISKIGSRRSRPVDLVNSFVVTEGKPNMF